MKLIRHVASNTYLALKKFKDPQVAWREYSNVQSVKCSRVPQPLAYAETDTERPKAYILYPLIDGKNLFLYEGRDIDVIKRAFFDVLTALQATHDAGMNHGDTLGGNLMIDRHGRGHLIDFDKATTPFCAKKSCVDTQDVVLYFAHLLQRAGLAQDMSQEFSASALPKDLLAHPFFADIASDAALPGHSAES